MKQHTVPISNSAVWGAIVGTGTFSMSGFATVYMADNHKFVDISIACLYYDEIDWRSREELNGYFDNGAPTWIKVLGNMEVFGDFFFDNILHMNYNLEVPWTETRTFQLE